MKSKIKKTFNDLLFNIHNKTLFRVIFYALFYKNMKDKKKRHEKKTKLFFNYKFNYLEPHSFNEYLIWIKLYYRNDLWKLCADKLKCKEFLIENGFEKYVPKTLGVYNSSKDIKLDDLPQKFVLKTNHDSGSVFICDKSKTDFSSVFKRLDSSIKNNYSASSLEWFYDDIKPLIFAEELLTPSIETPNDLIDYKFFVFSGRFRFGFAAVNRSVAPRFNLFENDFKMVNCEYIHLKSPKKKQPVKPSSFDELKDLAEKIGKHFDFVRVDLYNTNEGPKIGELTFTSMSGFGQFTKKEYDFKYGEYFKDTIFYKLANPEQNTHN